jgi:uncharacterized cofD-like protein
VRGEPLKAVALGGGHGLHAALSALRTLTPDLTAVVTVADDGGSSGRIRRELNVLPPGDLRMALVALAGDGPEEQRWAELLQHRLGGTGVLSGHPLGNLLLTGLLEREDDAISALQRLGGLVGAVGRVLPMSPVPLDIIAEADRFDPEDPDRVREIRGQSSVAATPGRVRAVRLLPPGAPACAQAVDAVREADLVVLGPGSWFTSVIPHLLLHELGRALATTSARVLITLNLVPQVGETDEYSPVDLLRVLDEHAARHGGLRVDAVIADEHAVTDPKDLVAYTRAIGAHLVLSRLAADDAEDRHDPQRLGCAFRQALQDSAAAGGGEGVDGWR